MPEGRRLAVVAPHPDDESIGAGGLIALWSAAGRDAEVVFLTRGGGGARELRDPHRGAPDTAALRASVEDRRQAEAEAALAILGARALWLDGTDGALHTDESRLSAAVRAHWKAAPPDVIAAPFPADRHPDHAVAARIVAAAAPRTSAIYAYEVWSPCVANVALDIAPVADRKARAIAAHASQVATTDYGAAVAGLNLYRGITAGLGARPAEAFWQTTPADYGALAATLEV
ncbi:MAG TPA: PIG-L family deacetylase [Amaricoccus sp.]|nr:PIG-L family deacetylase [Amaricoccus sp.]